MLIVQSHLGDLLTNFELNVAIGRNHDGLATSTMCAKRPFRPFKLASEFANAAVRYSRVQAQAAGSPN